MRKLPAFTLLLSLIFVSGTIDLNNLDDYSNQSIPSYITNDNTPSLNPITNAGATLGRVLFYDKKLSVNNNISCANCHFQQFAFSDTSIQSMGTNTLSSRHSMRLVNMRFGEDPRVLWSKSITNLEAHNSLPFKAENAMGFSGQAGSPDFDSLISRMEQWAYYPSLFDLAFGSPEITELKISGALSQFIRSIQSFDAKYDTGRAMVNHDSVDFPNFTVEENMGKSLFMREAIFDTVPDTVSNRIGGGAGCASCHRPPEFDIDPGSLNNGIVNELNGSINPLIFRSPTLRDMLGPDGEINTRFMHNGGGYTGTGDVDEMLDHYNHIVPKPGTDPRLTPGGYGQHLHLTPAERQQLLAFFKTLTGHRLYHDKKWSDPFKGGTSPLIQPDQVNEHFSNEVFPSMFIPAGFSISQYELDLKLLPGKYRLAIYDMNGKVLHLAKITESYSTSTNNMANGIVLIQVLNEVTGQSFLRKWILYAQ